MRHSALLLFASTALLSLAPLAPAAATEELPTTCVIDGVVFDECPLGDEGGPPWGGGGSGNLPLLKPDLGARGGGFAVSPSCLSPGRPFQARAVIENFGGLDFRGNNLVQVDFYLVTPNTVAFPAANLLGSTTIVFPFVTSASLGEVGVLVPLSGDLPDIAAGQYQLGVHIDATDEMIELVESNNKVVAGDVVAVGDCVDLVPALDGTSVSSPVTQGETLVISGAVRNEGAAALAGPRSLVIRYRAVPEGGDELGGTVLGQSTVAIDAGGSLAPGAVRIAPPLSVDAGLPPGNYAIAADVDHGGADGEGAVDEVDEDNNSALVGSVEINARPPGKPDYVVTKAQVTGQEKDPIAAGFRLTVSIRLGNLGDNALPGFYPEVRVVASPDEVIDEDDFPLRDFPSAQSLFAFGPAASLSRLVTLEVPWAAELADGNYTIGVVVDPLNLVVESEDRNNTAIAGSVRAQTVCRTPATLEQARKVFQDVFTSVFPLPVEPATHPALAGELCENSSFSRDLEIFTTEPDDCFFSLPYLGADIFIIGTLKPAMQRACVTDVFGLIGADPTMVKDTYAAAAELKRHLGLEKMLCDLHHDGPRRRYCACSNTEYLNWAPGPAPGECVYLPRFP